MQFYGKIRHFYNEENETISIEAGYQQFHNFSVAKNLSEKTIHHYDMCFKFFKGFYDISKPCYSVTENTIFEYIAHLKKNHNINDISLNTYLRAMRSIFYYFIKQGYTQPFQISLPKATKKTKETYNDYELTILLEKPNINQATFTEYRNWVLVNYLLGTGNRESTVCNVKIEDIDLSGNEIHLCKTKNRREQIIPISNSLKKVLKEYLQYRKGEDNDYLFCSITGERLTENALRHGIRRHNLKRGVLKTGVHLFRHTFAKKWILNGGDVFRLQKILGHSSMEIVREYVNMFNDDLKKDFDNFNPLEEFHKKSGAERGKSKFTKDKFRKSI